MDINLNEHYKNRDELRDSFYHLLEEIDNFEIEVIAEWEKYTRYNKIVDISKAHLEVKEKFKDLTDTMRMFDWLFEDIFSDFSRQSMEFRKVISN